MLLTLPCPRTSRLSRFSSDSTDWQLGSGNKPNLEHAFAAKCSVASANPAPSNRRWCFLTRRLSNYYEHRQPSLACEMAPSPSLTLALSRRPNSVPTDPFPDSVPYLERYRVYRQPILLSDCVLENIADGEVRFPSLRRTLSSMLADPGFRELVSLPLSATVLQGLARAGYTCVNEVIDLDPDRLVSSKFTKGTIFRAYFVALLYTNQFYLPPSIWVTKFC
ncbi:unnamed protein product [Echinostoma caproni]|uniref:Uncharacterized protein n=1 Tax=Echinostoma caproni TaxID=27848 RepID=A0A183AWL7_9TREM|nr:unnamed protein product [Echinostoma caproni]